jgi:hypothetical protein
MHLLIFARHAETSVDLARLLQNAARVFEPDIRVQQLGPGQLSGGFFAGVRVMMKGRRDDWTASFACRVRRATVTDLAAAREADARAREYMLSLLAEDCPLIWELDPEPPAQEKATALMAALVASAALGPVMAEDGSQLFGVRTALERAGVLSVPGPDGRPGTPAST